MLSDRSSRVIDTCVALATGRKTLLSMVARMYGRVYIYVNALFLLDQILNTILQIISSRGKILLTNNFV